MTINFHYHHRCNHLIVNIINRLYDDMTIIFPKIQIVSALYERSVTNNIKLSAVMRELAPQAEHVFRGEP